MASLKLVANPTFKAKVSIPVAGSAPVVVEMTFRHRTKTALDEFISSRGETKDTDTFLAMVTAWDLTDEFTPENVGTLLENYIGTALAAYRVYIDELVQAKAKN
jgi:hypothetical protein